MHRILLLVMGLVALSQQKCRHHHRRHNQIQHLADYHTRVFEEIAQIVIGLDKKSKDSCHLRSNATKEVYENNRYVLKVPLSDFEEEDVKVQVRHRVVYIKAAKADSEKQFSEVKELPAFVNAAEAKFTLDDGVLQVAFPTKKTVPSICDTVINDEVINVPKFEIISGQTQPRGNFDE